MTLVKICGITNIEDALVAVEAGADMLGFVFAESPRQVTAEAVSAIVRELPSHIKTVGVFTEESDSVEKAADLCGLAYIQLHGCQSEEFAELVGADRVIRALRMKDRESLDGLVEYRNAAFYLLDSYVPGNPGGTGQSFDWELAIEAKRFNVPIILAGGLNPGNIAEAVIQIRPHGVDVSSGVEASPGLKDHRRVKELIENVRAVDITA